MHQTTTSDRLAVLQRAYLLEQLATEGAETKPLGKLNRQITAAARRELGLTVDVANAVRRELAGLGYLRMSKDGQKVSYGITEAGRSYLAGLERPALGGRNRPAAVEESAFSDEVREAQKAYLLLQLLDADGRALTRKEANNIPKSLRASLGLKPAVANYRRAKLAEQNCIRMSRKGRGEEYSLTSDGLDYLAAGARHLAHATFPVKGKTLNALVAAARESSFEDDRTVVETPSEWPAPARADLEAAVLAEFQELRRERHARSGLVPIHEVRGRIAEHFGPAAAGHDVLDEVILGLWRQRRLGLEAISDLSDATEQQMNDGIQGVHGTLFYLEAPREQPVASEPLQ